MDNAHPVMQQALQPFRPWTAAEREAMAHVEARNRAEDERRLHKAIERQQQAFYRGEFGGPV